MLLGGGGAGVSSGDRKANPLPWTLRRDRAMVVDGKENGAHGIQKEEVEKAEEGVLMLVWSETRHFCFGTGVRWTEIVCRILCEKKKILDFFWLADFSLLLLLQNKIPKGRCLSTSNLPAFRRFLVRMVLPEDLN